MKLLTVIVAAFALVALLLPDSALGTCCPWVLDPQTMKCECADGSLVHPWDCCASGGCNVFCCNCAGDCIANVTTTTTTTTTTTAKPHHRMFIREDWALQGRQRERRATDPASVEEAEEAEMLMKRENAKAVSTIFLNELTEKLD